MTKISTVGSICSGIEAASVAWAEFGFKFSWFSEISKFPSDVLKDKYPTVDNLGDMNQIPDLLESKQIDCPDLICGGTPCQAFSFAGWQNGLNDDRGNLTLKFVDIIKENDKQRATQNKAQTIVFWENVEGVLKDKTNAFGCLVSSLAGLESPIEKKKWPNAGVIRGPERNVAWRLLDAKFFGIPQQRKRLYLLAGGKDFFPENILFEKHTHKVTQYPDSELTFEKDGHTYEVFRSYTDCLYASYGTKWNGNAAAYNGSLFVVQDGRIRRLSPLECERLMGFPDNYTDISTARKTTRYQATGNSWVVPVVRWIGRRLCEHISDSKSILNQDDIAIMSHTEPLVLDDKGTTEFFVSCLGGDEMLGGINTSVVTEEATIGTMKDIVSPDAPEDIYLSPIGCNGILRRKEERNMNINTRLCEVLSETASKMPKEEIEKISRRQHRGRFSLMNEDEDTQKIKNDLDALPLFSSTDLQTAPAVIVAE